MTAKWFGDERRRHQEFNVCPLHNNIEVKLNTILDRQIAQIETIAEVKAVIQDDGLKVSVLETSACVRKLTMRIEVIEKFSWFIEWMTQLRDNLFKRSLQLALVGGILFAVIHFGNKILSKAIG